MHMCGIIRCVPMLWAMNSVPPPKRKCGR
jgi:hypothetical protein